ncbi:MAG: Ig-like domain-containing protein [Lachnospira sp.]|nr:Ig-like domain-containing protein [Lachnospira sp.]
MKPYIRTTRRIIILLVIAILWFEPALSCMAVPKEKGNTTSIQIDSIYVINRNEALQLEPRLLGDNSSSNTSDFTYSSSNRSIAKVDENGLVTALKKGHTKIRITSKSNTSTYCYTRIYVGKLITKLKLNTTKKTITQGNYYMLKATVGPKRAAYKKLEYTSSNPSVAKVSTKGKITAISPGNATITVRTLDGSNLSKSCVITVTALTKKDDEETTRVFPNPFFQNNMKNNNMNLLETTEPN